MSIRACRRPSLSPTLDALRQLQIANLKTLLDLAKKGAPKFTEYKVAEDITKTVQARADQVGIYFFHPTSIALSTGLGSAIFLTDGMGNPYQFFINLPFGEIEAERSSLKSCTLQSPRFSEHL